MVDLCNSLTGNSGQMLYLYYAQVIINFTEVAIKQEKICMQNSHSPQICGKKKWHFHWTLYKTVRKGQNDQNVVIFTKGIFQTI